MTDPIIVWHPLTEFQRAISANFRATCWIENLSSLSYTQIIKGNTKQRNKPPKDNNKTHQRNPPTKHYTKRQQHKTTTRDDNKTHCYSQPYTHKPATTNLRVTKQYSKMCLKKKEKDRRSTKTDWSAQTAPERNFRRKRK